MYLGKTRKFSRRVRRFEGLLTENPVLSLGLALPFVISASYSLQAAVCILMGVVAVTLPMTLLAAAVGRRVPQWLLLPICALASGAILIPVQNFAARQFPVVVNSLGVYFPIIAVNTLMIYFCIKAARRGNPLRTLWTVCMHLCGFAAVILPIAAVRELFGNGSFWGLPVPWASFKLGGLLIPFGGCILAGFAAAAGKFFGRLLRGGLYRSDLKNEHDRASTGQMADDEDLRI